MASKVWRPDRCAACGKRREHENHGTPARRSLLRRFLWPNRERNVAGVHEFQDDAPRARLVEEMYAVRERMRKRRQS